MISRYEKDEKDCIFYKKPVYFHESTIRIAIVVLNLVLVHLFNVN